MSGRIDRRRGEPLFVLVVLLTAWIGTRAMTWESPLRPLQPVLEQLSRSLAASEPGPAAPAAVAEPQATQREVPWRGLPSLRPPRIRPLARLGPSRPPHSSVMAERPALASGDVMASHQLLWLAAMAQIPVPADVAALLRAKAVPRANGPRRALARQRPDRWSFDAWLLLRPGGAAPSGTLASYGASQAGAVARYRLAPDSAHRPAAYVRTTQALAAGRESELAVGLSARPLADIPVSLHSEIRVTRHGGGPVELRPAAFAVTELPPKGLPLGLRGEVYVQTGYVGGEFATAFADGQARIDREVVRFDLAAVRAGAGIWGGAQKGAARLDIGPTASLDLDVGGTPARLAFDYRWRIAGEAAPGRGIAVTLSTGF